MGFPFKVLHILNLIVPFTNKTILPCLCHFHGSDIPANSGYLVVVVDQVCATSTISLNPVHHNYQVQGTRFGPISGNTVGCNHKL